MQYQILDKHNNIIAWIDTNDDKILAHKDYTILCGEKLDAINVAEDIKPVIRFMYKGGE